MKVGKFSRKTLGMNTFNNLTAYGGLPPAGGGVGSPVPKIWFGPINKNTGAAASMTFNLRGPTWDFEWVDYMEVHSRPHAGTTLGQARGTVAMFYNHNPTVWVPATLNVNQTRCFLYIIGRTGGR